MSRHPEAGLTLVEVLVALALFAVIGAAGFAVLDQVVRVQANTDGRLQHLAQMQRAQHLLTQDFMLATGGSLDAGDGAVAFRRSAGHGQLAVRYVLDGAEFTRRVSEPGGPATRQVLLSGVSAADWRFYAPGLGWTDVWPPDPRQPPANPAAVAVEVTLAGPGLSGRLRRIALLPAEVTQ
jgi:general secretion pathway protein J